MKECELERWGGGGGNNLIPKTVLKSIALLLTWRIIKFPPRVLTLFSYNILGLHLFVSIFVSFERYLLYKQYVFGKGIMQEW